MTHCSERNQAGHPLIIGSEVTVEHKAMLHGCTIGNRILIGMGSIILDGTVIEYESSLMPEAWWRPLNTYITTISILAVRL